MIAIWASVSTNRRKWLTTESFIGSLFLFSEVFYFMDWEIALEVFGYIGTALVIVSMLMTDINKLRIINISGGVISLIYAICVNTMPVVVLNATLITINTIQLIKSLRAAKIRAELVNSKDGGAYNKENTQEKNI
jgi:hypothetical protein